MTTRRPASTDEKRTRPRRNIVLEPEEHEMVVSLAKESRLSVSALIGELIRGEWDRRKRQKRGS